MTRKSESMKGIEAVNSKVIANNTIKYERPDGTKAIRLHFTDIITFNPDKSITLNTGGWLTVTTKTRMNEYLPHPWRVYQEKNSWYLSNGEHNFPYQDGIKISIGNEVTNAGKDAKRNDKIKKQIKTYTDNFIAKLIAGKIDKPGAGDCWYCSFKTADGKSMGDIGNKSEHILSHIREKYFVPSLLINAVEEFNISTAAEHCLGYWLGYHADKAEFWEDLAKQQIKKALTRYLYRRIGLAS